MVPTEILFEDYIYSDRYIPNHSAVQVPLHVPFRQLYVGKGLLEHVDNEHMYAT